MKLANVFVFVCLFFFLIGCDNNVKKLTPTEEVGDDSETIDDSEIPDTEAPDTELPDTETPDTEVPDTETPDSETPDGEIPDTEVSDGEISDGDTPEEPTPEDSCYAAEFNGTDSKIEIPAAEALNLAYETWTIEAWIKEAEEDITSDNIPVVRKGSTTISPVYLLTSYKKQQQGWGDTSSYVLVGYVSYSYTSSMGMGQGTQQNGTIQPSGSATYSEDWSHIAMVQVKEETQGWGNQQTTTYKLLLFLNGKQVASSDYKANNMNVTPTVNTNEDPLVIGANLNSKFFFKGLIDSVKISNTAKYVEDFTPSVLTSDENTVAFWDFTNNADDSSSNGLNGTGTNINYVKDCKK